MRIGFGLPHHGVRVSPENIVAVAERAETVGYDSLWTLDRVIKTIDFTTPYPGSEDGSLGEQYDTVYEHLTVLTYVAALTSRIRLGVSVLNLPLYQPVLLAKRLATLDQLSGGRLIVGLGAGWSEDEFAAAGGDFRRRGAVADDYLGAMKALWKEDEVEYRGRFVEIRRSVFGPKPRQEPHPPLLMGAFSARALARAATAADGFMGCCAPVGTLLSFRRRMEEAAEAAGRRVDALQSIIRCNVHLQEEALPDESRPFGSGTFAQVRDDVLRLRDAGVDEVFFDIYHQTHLTRGDEVRQFEQFRGILG
ncbi:TIGR03619 family F420-dependent LLM class oxidoreductase [Microbacterium sp. BR1]|uniref:TIGR03619 family F420-dependent LLM class oxidoreductase n=1 Tax=Microbacterium sp. BR1 TaxID=1070896 RepID=UPI000C2C6584|nr:TIGR03619 family F420-dependent LLM class oxidoreductase [Microbacterium sp. BR1]